ncbi:MAG TPA: hypothetical protein VGK50_01735 [Coriobacteriia bacterium]|jgi:Fic family protein
MDTGRSPLDCSLLRDGAFVPLAEEAVCDYITWDELTRRPLPPGMSAADTWEVLATIRRFGATWFPIAAPDGARYWYTLTREAIGCLQVIEHHCRADSSLHLAMLEREGRRFLVRSQVQEAIATCQLDGVDVSYEDAGRLLQTGRTPQTATERFVANSFALLGELEELASEPLSPAMVRHVYDRLAEGVDQRELHRLPARYNLSGVTHPGEELTSSEAEKVLQDLCDYGNGVTGQVAEPAAMRGYAFMSSMGYWHPLPDFNGTVARHMLRVFAVKKGYPVLGYLPVSLMTREWAEGRVHPPTVRFTELDQRQVLAGEIDYTQDALTHLQLTVAAIDDLLAYVEKTRRRDAEMESALEGDEALNFRQRSVLSRALVRPNAEFRIRHHQMTHHVVYSTARADLTELVERSYLLEELSGKTLIFRPAPDLKERLGVARDG